MEPEIAALLPAEAALYHTRIPSAPTVTRETLKLMEADMPAAAALLPDRRFDAIGYGCTSGATVIGPDRVAALRDANIYEPQSYRHILSLVRVLAEDSAVIQVETNFLVVRTMHSGDQMLYASGRYLDRIVRTDSGPRFAEKLVLLDSEKIDTLLAIPL